MSTGVVIGAGDRGYDAYTTHLLDHPEDGRVVAVAEPDPTRRQRFAARYDLPASGCFETWEDLLAGPRLADWALVAAAFVFLQVAKLPPWLVVVGFAVATAVFLP